MPLKALLSHYFYHPWQTLFLLTGLAAGLALWSAVQIISSHARASYENAGLLLGANITWLIEDRAGGELPFEHYVRLRRAGFRALVPVLEGRVMTEKGQLISITGTDLLAVPGSGSREAGRRLSASDWHGFVTPPWQTWTSREMAASFGLKEGEQLPLLHGKKLPAVRILEAAETSIFLLDIGAAMHLLPQSGLSYIAVLAEGEKQLAEMRDFLPETLVLRANRSAPDLRQLTRSLHIHLSAMSFLSFAVGLFIVISAVHFSLRFRQPTLFALRLAGVSPGQLLGWLLLETLILGLLGTVLGLAAGYWLAQILLPGFAGTLEMIYEAEIALDLLLQPDTFLLALLLACSGLLPVLTLPLASRARRPLAETLSARCIWQNDQKIRFYLLLFAAAPAILAFILWQRAEDVVGGFLLLGCCLLTAVCILPALLAGLLNLAGTAAQKSGRFVLRWVLMDGRAQLPWLRTSMMALLLALTANLGVETLLDSFRSAFNNWLEPRLSADIYLRGTKADPALLQQLGRLHARSMQEFRWQGRILQLRGLDPLAPDTADLPLAATRGRASRLLLAESDASVPALANEQMRHLAGVQQNEIIFLPGKNGRVAIKIVGFFHDYGNSSLQLYMAADEVKKYWPATGPESFALWLNEQQNLSRADIDRRLQAAGFDRWIRQSEIRALSSDIFERTFAVIAAIKSLTLLVAGIALASSLFAMLQMRRAEFALWRALGVSSPQMLLLLALPTGLFLLVTWLLSLPLGFLLAFLLIHDLNLISFGWTMPLAWSFAPALHLLLLCSLILLLALLPALLRRNTSAGLAELSAGGTRL